MEDIYEHILDNDVLDKIESGKCIYFVCVNTRNIQSYKEGNVLTFVSGDKQRIVKVKIKAFFYFASVKELVNMLKREKCGYSAGKNLDTLEDEHYALNKPNAIEKFGFVAIEFEVIK